MGELLLNTDFLRVHIPLANGAVLATRQEKVVFLRVPLAIVDARYVAFSVRHIEQVHVTADCRLLAYTLCIVDLGLVVPAAAQEVSATRIERQSAHRVSIEGLEVLERLQVAVHGREIPDLHTIVQTASQHLGALTIDADRLN